MADRYTPKKLKNYGKIWELQGDLYVAQQRGYVRLFAQYLGKADTRCCIMAGESTRYSHFWVKIFIVTHEFPCHPFPHEDADGQ
jgi:hypothetical protein